MKNLKNSDVSIEDIPSDVFICRFIEGDFVVVDGNETALHSLKLHKKEIYGKNILDILPDIKETDFFSTLQEAYNSSQMIEFNIPCYFNGNLCRWHKGSVKKLFNGDLILYYKNIELEKELEMEELRYQLELFSEAPYVGICIFGEKFLYANQVLEAILGYSFEELKEIAPIDLLHLENKEEYTCNLEKRLKGERFTTAYYDAKLLRKDNKEIFVRLCIKTVQYRGKYVALASVIDVTKMIEQEQKTKRLAQALEQTDDLLLMTDVEGRIIYVNNRVVQKLGYAKEELMGQKVNIFKSGKHSRRFYKRLWNTILSGEKYSNMIINRTKKGKLIYLETTITPVFDKENKIESFVSTSKDVSYQMKTKKRLKNLATIDTLTKVLNRYAIDKEIDYSISLAQRHELSFSILMLDIDHFKTINDQFGHYIGDVVLKAMTKVVQKNIRKVDKFGRWGGEEFIIILHGTSQKKALKKAQEVREFIQNNIIDDIYKITASIGVTSFKEEDTKASLLARVDEALYKAKEQGRNKVVVY
ncbi:diguanylate cyclase [Sulfurimonas paralvinellae]|uniref:Diguanylate cyclase n=1 Tax=Sulfurimonas paralvinellae TaxID=317658 RepID=A0A7M1B8L7_9BACT|nr:diguanylate cyclase [Sulfurimonas paralvinellae]QOP45092.1 diguanylate cyclase [Sulfurimonas paralvinellae]